MVTAAYSAYCVISLEGDDDTYDGKTAGSHSWEVKDTVKFFHVLGGGHFLILHDNNTHWRQFNVSIMTGIHNLLHEFWEPWPNRTLLDPVLYGAVLYGVTTVSRHKLSQNDHFVSSVTAILKVRFQDHVTPISAAGPQSSWALTWLWKRVI